MKEIYVVEEIYWDTLDFFKVTFRYWVWPGMQPDPLNAMILPSLKSAASTQMNIIFTLSQMLDNFTQKFGTISPQNAFQMQMNLPLQVRYDNI